MKTPFCGDEKAAPVQGNASLALTRFVPWPKDDNRRRNFFQSVVKIQAGEAYQKAFLRWAEAKDNPKALRVTATLGGPLAVGLGNESPYEVGLTLHRIYGMPLIPGSAIKGACRRAIRKLDEAKRTQAGELFGTTDNAGFTIFHDAWFDPSSLWPDPDSGRQSCTPLALDTITVHHPNYHQNKGNVFPTDFDDPTPIPFISVRAGAKFLFVIEIPDVDPDVSQAWLAFVKEMLCHTLTEIGIGGKTNAGYGWFIPDSEYPSAPAPETSVAQEEEWQDCELERRDEHRGGWEIRVRLGEKRTTVSQGEWNKLPGSPAPLQKGKRRTATVRVQVHGNDYKVVEVKL